MMKYIYIHNIQLYVHVAHSPLKMSVRVKLKGEISRPAVGEGQPAMNVESPTTGHGDLWNGVCGMGYGVCGMGYELQSFSAEHTSCSGLPLAISARV